MKKREIKFSHNYKKLHGQSTAKLLQVDIVHFSDLSIDFIKYDTFFIDENGEGFFELPVQTLMVLAFIGDKRIPFTTVRKLKSESYEYHKKNIGEFYDMVIVDGSSLEKKSPDEPRLPI